MIGIIKLLLQPIESFVWCRRNKLRRHSCWSRTTLIRMMLAPLALSCTSGLCEVVEMDQIEVGPRRNACCCSDWTAAVLQLPFPSRVRYPRTFHCCPGSGSGAVRVGTALRPLSKPLTAALCNVFGAVQNKEGCEMMPFSCPMVELPSPLWRSGLFMRALISAELALRYLSLQCRVQFVPTHLGSAMRRETAQPRGESPPTFSPLPLSPRLD